LRILIEAGISMASIISSAFGNSSAYTIPIAHMWYVADMYL